MIYNLNDSYYINQAIDIWLTGENEESAADSEDEKNIEERCKTDD